MIGSSSIRNIPNWIASKRLAAQSADWFDKFCPHNGRIFARVARSTSDDIDHAVCAATAAQPAWADLPIVRRGQVLADIATAMRSCRKEIAELVAIETGKSLKDALGETAAAIQQADFFAGEGMRLFGRSLPSAMEDKYSHTVRQPIGIAGLIVPANTPIANIAWKLFPALICGNAIVLKASEDAPAIAVMMAELAEDAGLPAGLFNVIQGLGLEAGRALVEHPSVGVISFTGSTEAGRWIAATASQRLARISLELGGKNPLVICDDADIEKATRWAVLSAFSNAGQRCASGSRIIIMDAVYDIFRASLVEATQALRLGIEDDCDLGPVINARQHVNILAAVDRAVAAGATLVAGGKKPLDASLARGYYLEPTILEDVDPQDDISVTEVFGPVTILYRAADYNQALTMANSGAYGLTASIHTQNLHRAMHFCQKVRAGVANVNIGTFGSEPHMPFGGFRFSGNGTREPGTEALDVYSELKNISFVIDRSRL